MKKNELSLRQVNLMNRFIEKLTKVEWYFENKVWFEGFENDKDVWPDAELSFLGENSKLLVSFNPGNNYFSLLIGDLDEVEFKEYRIYFGDKFDEILKFLIDFQSKISLENLSAFLLGLLKITKEVYNENQGLLEDRVSGDEYNEV